MATPATPAIARTAGPLDGLRFEGSGPPGAADALVAEHLRLLGARPDGTSEGRFTVTGREVGEVCAGTVWGETATDEATVQAATGIMAVHGRRDGTPRGLAVDYAATATGVLAVQGLLAGLLARARGAEHITQVEVSAERAGLLTVSQYLAAAGAEEGEAAELAPGGPPFISADGTVFELETLDPGVWAAFWRALEAPEEAIRRGWRPFQFRYATACAPFPHVLHEVVRASSWERIRQAAGSSGADVCPLGSLAGRAAEYDGAAPWGLAPHDATYVPRGAPEGGPLAGFTVLEAGRRIQAPLAAHVLGLLGAEVVRIEPPGGDPLRGMPPACSGISARWLALNRGKKAVEVDIKSPSDRERLREMAADADVFLHNWAPGKAAQLGLDHEHLAVANPALVYAYTSGWADRLPDTPMGTDFMVQARTGVGEAVRPADEAPAPSLMTLLDVLGGLLGAEAALAGLLLRERTGAGVRVDSSLLGAADVLTAPAQARAAQGLDPRRPAGFRRPLRTADGWIALPDHAAIPYDVSDLSTAQALERLHDRGLPAVPVVTDLADLLSSGSISRDAHGAPRRPEPLELRMTVDLHDLLPAELRRAWAVDGTCPDLDLYSLFRARQIADLHRTAVLDAKGKLCYTALDRKVRCLAAGLSALGIRAGDVVGIQLPNGRNAVIADLALAALGAVALPFPVGRGGREAASLLRRAEAVAVIAATEHRDSRHAADLLALTVELPALHTVIAAGPGTAPDDAVAFSALLRTDPKSFTAARPDPDSAARILVSSGSEAEPKMVAYSHNALAGGRGNFLASLIPDDRPPRCLFLVPLASAFGSNGTAVTLARHGGTLVLLDHFTPEAALDALAEHEPTHVLGVPTMIRMMLDRIAEGHHPAFSPPTAVIVGGSPLDEATADEARRVFGCPVVNLYGSADGVNCHTGLGDEPLRGEGPGILAGHPDPRVADIRIAVPDAPEFTEAPKGSVGEIVARGPMTPLCYVAAPDLDARYRTADGWVRTGDLGLIEEDGNLRIVGRLKDVVIRGGANISPAEVEIELATHPLVRDVVCVGVPDPLMGERLAACVVPRGDAPTREDLSAHLDARGLERRKHPEHLLIVTELPLTPAGKPDRALLRERCSAQAPESLAQAV